MLETIMQNQKWIHQIIHSRSYLNICSNIISHSPQSNNQRCRIKWIQFAMHWGRPVEVFQMIQRKHLRIHLYFIFYGFLHIKNENNKKLIRNFNFVLLKPIKSNFERNLLYSINFWFYFKSRLEQWISKKYFRLI